jgi:hypothetical protein
MNSREKHFVVALLFVLVLWWCDCVFVVTFCFLRSQNYLLKLQRTGLKDRKNCLPRQIFQRFPTAYNQIATIVDVNFKATDLYFYVLKKVFFFNCLLLYQIVCSVWLRVGVLKAKRRIMSFWCILICSQWQLSTFSSAF